MKTPEQWLQETPLGDFSSDEALRFIAAIQDDAYCAGERRGRTDGLREAAQFILSADTEHGKATRELCASALTLRAERLKREQNQKEGQ